MKLYNTASKTVEDFISIEDGKVSLYACGPTVYHYAHIGNLRTYVFEDILRRTLESAGYAVNHVMNITDVGHLQSDGDDGDDKMSVAAAREKKSPWDIAKYYEEAFFKHAGLLNIIRPHIICRATDHIAEMIAMVEKLIAKGFAYQAGGNVYFDVAKFPDYATFANLHLEGQSSTDRVDHDEHKRNAQDFVLWFSNSKFPNQIMKWDSPWGVGFPGWHIECSAMATKYLGERIDIHCGGIDHIPVHHTNEIAQAQCCVDHDDNWVNYWMHGAFLTMDSGKMSKSKGDILTVDKLIDDGFSPMSYRYLLLSAHYRSELKFSYDNLTAAQTAYQNMYEKVQSLSGDEISTSSDALNTFIEQFNTALHNDLDTPKALQIGWTVLKSDLSDSEKYHFFKAFDAIFGFNLIIEQNNALSDEEQALIDARETAKAEKNWAEADRIRDILLNDHHLKIRDTKDGLEHVRIAH